MTAPYAAPLLDIAAGYYPLRYDIETAKNSEYDEEQEKDEEDGDGNYESRV